MSNTNAILGKEVQNVFSARVWYFTRITLFYKITLYGLESIKYDSLTYQALLEPRSVLVGPMSRERRSSILHSALSYRHDPNKAAWTKIWVKNLILNN